MLIFVLAAGALWLVLAGCSPAQSASSATSVATIAKAEATTATVTETISTPTSESLTSSSSAVTCTRLNLNELTEEQLLATIPNFPSRMVREFFEYRPYVSIQQFRTEIGKYVDAAQVTEWEQYVYVPIDRNNADADTLMQLPGVDATITASLMSGRPYGANEDFVDVLVKSVTPEQAAAADCLLSA